MNERSLSNQITGSGVMQLSARNLKASISLSSAFFCFSLSIHSFFHFTDWLPSWKLPSSTSYNFHRQRDVYSLPCF